MIGDFLKIEFFCYIVMNFYGFLGSGKSLGFYAIVYVLGKLIIVVSYV